MSASSCFASVSVLLKTRKLRRVPMVPDGNCFYRAVATVFYRNVQAHKTLRTKLMNYMLEYRSVYGMLFESEQRFRSVLSRNKRRGVWNTDLADVAPLAMANLLGVTLEIFIVGDDGEVRRYTFNESLSGTKIRLLHENNHYDVLLR